mgnify:CR=1 FL=1
MQLTAKATYLSHNQVVPGSSPGGTTKNPSYRLILRGLFFLGE